MALIKCVIFQKYFRCSAFSMIIRDEREIGENCSIRDMTFEHNEREFLVIELS